MDARLKRLRELVAPAIARMPKFKAILILRTELRNSWHLRVPRSGLPLYSHFHLRETSRSPARSFLRFPHLLHHLLHLGSFGSLTALRSTAPRPRPLVYHRLLAIPPFFRVFGEPRAFFRLSRRVVSPDFCVSSYTRAAVRHGDRDFFLVPRYSSLRPVLSQILVAGYEIARKTGQIRASL